ncbi:MAG: hypothetical protein IPG55_16700 [Saprospiraceae bacterium]|nr:hypothetical protein [Candidatus Defluviibacterium haderslevense]
MQEIQLNIIPFTAPIEEAEFAFYTAKQNGYCPIHKDDLKGAIEVLVGKRKALVDKQVIYFVGKFRRMYWKSLSLHNPEHIDPPNLE